jgi:hypothetical protein
MAQRLSGHLGARFLERLKAEVPVDRIKPGRVQKAFSDDEVRAIAEALDKGWSWSDINEELPYPYANWRSMATCVRRLAHAANIPIREKE